MSKSKKSADKKRRKRDKHTKSLVQKFGEFGIPLVENGRTGAGISDERRRELRRKFQTGPLLHLIFG